MKKETSPNRIKELRQAKGLTLEALADLTELSVSHLSRLEAGKRNLNFNVMAVIAQALGVRASELIDVSRAWIEIDITGITSEDQQIFPVSNGERARHKSTVNVPAALGDVDAVLVVGNILYPRYSDGDIITFAWQQDDINTLIGKECVILLTNGKTYIKTIAPGSQPGRYHLTSFNTPPIYDAEISRATRIGIVIRA
jgi:transcriptional regulator with XRE-family HTH domain